MSYYEAHDHEIPASDADRARQKADALGLQCAMDTPSFFADPSFKDGGMTANNGAVRRQAGESARIAELRTADRATAIAGHLAKCL